jgi:hypothetical protein
MLTVETIGRIRREHFLIREIARDLKVSRNTVRKVLLSGETSFDYERSVQPHTFLQAREASNPYYTRVPAIVQSAMNRFAALTGRAYTLFEYDGPPHAERVIVLMGSGAETARETAAFLRKAGEPVGVLQIRLYRPPYRNPAEQSRSWSRPRRWGRIRQCMRRDISSTILTSLARKRRCARGPLPP